MEGLNLNIDSAQTRSMGSMERIKYKYFIVFSLVFTLVAYPCYYGVLSNFDMAQEWWRMASGSPLFTLFIMSALFTLFFIIVMIFLYILPFNVTWAAFHYYKKQGIQEIAGGLNFLPLFIIFLSVPAIVISLAWLIIGVPDYWFRMVVLYAISVFLHFNMAYIKFN